MAELVLLTLNRREFHLLFQRARQGDEQAMAELDAFWDQHKEIACFLCDATISERPFTLMLPETGKSPMIMAAPLCTVCRELAPMVRLHKAIRILQQMYRRKNGKQMHFSFVAQYRH